MRVYKKSCSYRCNRFPRKKQLFAKASFRYLDEKHRRSRAFIVRLLNKHCRKRVLLEEEDGLEELLT
ncbi:hypothetical protein SK128_017092 [Halocaridina rubra]|uniref:Uncharacterized protein n=1 Tax=Halocaridina rubra TaxID=373956 RepID=A0AAN9AEM1_HALRR